MKRILVVVALLLPCSRADASAMCSVVGMGPGGWSTEQIADMVARASVIVRAAASDSAGEFVVFRPIEWIRGDSSVSTVRLYGRLVGVDDFNKYPVPYTWVRSAGQRGSCYAMEYRKGAEYLLLLQRGAVGLTTFWKPLAPVNEQLHAPDDPWLAWVRAQAGRTGVPRDP